MQLSPHFHLDEFTVSETADRLKLENTPPPEVITRLIYVAEQMEIAREVLGKPITITSGYRSPKVNAAVGSGSRSQHLLGEACDFVCPAYGPPAMVMSALIASGKLIFDQLILEFATKPGRGWVHGSFTKTPRLMALVIDDRGTRAYA